MTHLLFHGSAAHLLLALWWLAGYALQRTFFGAFDRHALRLLARLVLGLGFWIAAILALAAAGQLHRSGLAACAAAIVVVAGWKRRPWRWRPWLQLARRRWPPGVLSILAGAALAATLVPLFLLAVSPVVSWDASAYHLTLPRLFIENGGFRPVPFNVYSNWPLGTEMLFTMAMLVEDYVLAKLVHFGFGLLTLYAIWLGCRMSCPGRSGRPVGWLAMALFLANGVVQYELHVAYVDLAHAFFFLAAFLFLLRALGDGDGAPGALLLAGLCAGLVAGTKLNGVASVAILGTLYLPRLLAAARAGGLAAAAGRFLARFALPALVMWLPWLVKSVGATGNPVYPFFFGGPDWSPALGEQLRAWQSGIGMGREWLDYLLLPVRVCLEGGTGYDNFDGKVGAFWLAVVPLAALCAVRDRLVRRCLGVSGLYFLFWALTSQQTRLLIPILPLLAIAGAVSITTLIDRLPSRKAGQPVILLAAVALLVWSAAGTSPGPSKRRHFGTAGKALGRYLEAQGDLRTTAAHPVYGFVNEKLPADARLLFLNTNQGFFCERDYIADSFFEASQIADWLGPAKSVAELRRLLAEEGVRHFLIENRGRGIAYPPALFAMLRDPRQARLLYSSPEGRFTVVELLER